MTRERARTSLGPVGLVVYNVLYWPYLIGTCVGLFFVALVIFLLAGARRPGRALHRFTSAWAAHYLSWAPFAGVRVEGKNRTFMNDAFIMVVNHQSMVDILAVHATGLPFCWVSKIENFYAPFLGWNMWLNGYVPLRRGHLPSVRRMLRTCEARLSRGSSLCVFPEGTRSRDGELKSFYRGAFWLAARCNVPVLPVVVEGTGQILGKGKLGIRPQPVLVRILDPVAPSEAGGDDRRLRDLVFERMRGELARMRACDPGTR